MMGSRAWRVGEWRCSAVIWFFINYEIFDQLFSIPHVMSRVNSYIFCASTVKISDRQTDRQTDKTPSRKENFYFSVGASITNGPLTDPAEGWAVY